MTGQFEAFMSAVRSGSRLSPIALRLFLDMDVVRFAELAGVHRNTLSQPASPKLQRGLRDIVAALSALSRIEPDLDRAVFLFFCMPLRPLGHYTAAGAIREGKAAQLMEFLRSPAASVLARKCCRVCGCTDTRACQGGCSWVEHDLCSACKKVPS